MSTLTLKKVRDAARSLVAMTREYQISYLGKIQALLEAEGKRPAAPHKKLLAQLHNSALSLQEGLRTNDADLDDVKAYVKECFKVADEAMKLDDAEERKKQAGPAPVENQPMGDRRQSEVIINKYAKYKSLLPKRVETIKGVRMPVVPITKLPLDTGRLKKLGLTVDFIDGYPVFTNQLVVGMDHEWMETHFRPKRASPYVKDATEHVLQQLQLKTNQDWVCLGPPVRVAHVLWIWCVKSRYANLLSKTAIGGQMKLSKWGFAFK